MKITRRQLKRIIIESVKPYTLKEEAVTLASLAASGAITQIQLANAQQIVSAGLMTGSEMIASITGASSASAAAGAGALAGPTQVTLGAAGSVSGAATNLMTVLGGGAAFSEPVAATLAAAAAAEVVLIVAGIAAGAAAAVTGSMAAFESLKAKKRATAQFVYNVIKTALSRKLKSDKTDMDETTIKMAFRALKSKNPDALKVALETGLLKLDVNELDRALGEMTQSASAEYVDFDAARDAISEISRKK
jgi:hypothetical protein